MSIVVKGVIRDGQVEVDEPINLPDGSEVTITGHAHGKFFGLPDNDRPDTPEEIADWLKWYDSLEPLVFTPEEEADLAAWRQKVKDLNLEAVRRQMEEGDS